MASGVELGTAWIQIAPSMQGFKRSVASQMGDLGASASSKTAGQKIMSGLGGALKKVGKIGAGTMAGLGTAVAGIAAHGGISRALSIENAQAKLVGLGHDTKGVQAIMDSALASVKGTAFGLGDAATVAASLSATGLQAGKDLDGALKSVADVSQITGRSLTDVGAIFGSIAARGKLQGDDMLQLMSSGLPVLQMLGDELGVTSEQVSEMVSRGEIDFATFQRAMEKGVGGAALAAGETFQGAWSNIKAALGRIGAEAMTPVLNALRDSFNQLIPVVDSLGGLLGPVFETVGEKIGVAAAAAVDFITGLVDGSSGVDLSWVQTLGAGVVALAKGGFVFLTEAVKIAWSVLQTLVPVVGQVVGVMARLVGGILQNETASKTLVITVGALAAAYEAFRLGKAIKDFATLAKKVTLAQIAKAKDMAETAAIKAMYAWDGVKSFAANFASMAKQIVLSTAAKVKDIAVMVAHKTALIASTAATKTAAAAQKLFNLVMAANPIMLVVVAIGALVAGLAYFFTQTELGRQVWQTLVEAFHSFVAWIGQAWSATWQFLSDAWTAFSAWFVETWNAIWTGISEFFTSMWEGIKSFFQSVWDGIVLVVQVAWTIISTIVTTYINIISTIISTVLGVISSVWNAVWNGISGFVSTVWGAISGAVTAGINAVKSFIQSGMNLVSSLWSSTWNSVASFITGAWGRIKSGVSSGVSGMLGIVRNIPGKILSALGNLGSLLYSAGASVIQGFIDGINSLIGSVKDTLGKLTSWLPDWKGPAKVDARILYGSGELVMTGFKQGLEDQYAGVKRTLRGFTNDLALSPATVAVSTAGSVTPTSLARPVSTEPGGFTRGQPVNLVLRTMAGDVKLAVAAEIEEVLGAGGSARAEFGVA